MEKNTQTTVERIVETILAGIEKGTFTQGSALPAQRQLAEYFDVSRNAVREAIKVLEGLGVLYSKQGSGIYVMQSNVSQVRSKSPNKTYTLRQIIDLCRMIWQSSVFSVVKNAEDRDLLHLKKMNDNIMKNYASSSVHQRFIYESSFGISICQLSQNSLADELMKELLKATSELDYKIIVHSKYKDILNIDSSIIAALMARDAYRAFFWGNERDVKIEQMIEGCDELMCTTYKLNLFQEYCL